MSKLILTSLALLLASSPLHAAPKKAASKLQLCADSSGSVLAKKRCAATETRLNLEALQGNAGPAGPQGATGETGAQGPAGVNISECVPEGTGVAAVDGVSTVEVSCDEGFYLLNSDWQITGNTVPVERQSRFIFGEQTYPIGVRKIISRDLSLDDSFNTFTAFVMITCCPR